MSQQTLPQSTTCAMLPSLKSLYRISVLEQTLKSALPLITKASYSLKNGKLLLKLRLSIVLTGRTSELNKHMLNNVRSTFTTMVEWYLQGKSPAVMLTTNCEQSSDLFHLSSRLRGLGWKRWKCLLTLDLTGKKFVIEGVDPERSHNFIGSLVKHKLHLSRFSLDDKRYHTAVTRHMSRGHRAMTPEELKCLKNSRLARLILRSSEYDRLSRPALKSTSVSTKLTIGEPHWPKARCLLRPKIF